MAKPGQPSDHITDIVHNDCDQKVEYVHLFYTYMSESLVVLTRQPSMPLPWVLEHLQIESRLLKLLHFRHGYGHQIYHE